MTDDGYRVVEAGDLRPGPLRHESLPPWFVVRAELVHHVVGPVDHSDLKTFLDNFRRDADPVSELVIWERIASTFLALLRVVPPELRQQPEEVFGATLQASMLPPQPTKEGETLMDQAMRMYAAAGQRDW